MIKRRSVNDQKYEKLKKTYINEFNAQLPKMVERALEIPISYTENTPLQLCLGEATQCFICGFFDASIVLSRATLEQILKHRLGIEKSETVKLDYLIKLATVRKLLSNDLRSKAIKIQKWGNIYIHSVDKKDIRHHIKKNRAKEVLLALKEIVVVLYSMK